MSFLKIIWFIVIRPLQILFECIFTVVDGFMPNPGFTLIVLSLAVSLLALPLYLRADKIQKDYGDMMKGLQPRIDQIKKSFKGDERVMMLQAYYKQTGYSPVMSLRGSVSLLLQIPFFISMYTLISSLTVLSGVSFGPIKDLSLPDQMITIGGFGVNVLPILMTLINVVSSMIYGRGKKFSEQWQTYLLAAVFLVLLYTSPSGLVVYWTCNNIFSLVKNIVVGHLAKKAGSKAPVSVASVKENTKASRRKIDATDRLFIYSGLFLSIFLGVYIPSTVINSSPMEFLDFHNQVGPEQCLWSAFFVAFGFFMFWAGIYYLVLGEKYRKPAARLMVFLSVASAVNWFLFDTKGGNMNTMFVYDETPAYAAKMLVLNILVLIGVAVLVYLLFRFVQRALNYVMIVGAMAMLAIFLLNYVFICTYNAGVFDGRYDADKIGWTLSTEGNNVVVIMLDRALGPTLPYIFEERPELRAQFDGFTYYPNTVSFGARTNIASSCLFGGYEYTPEQMNARDDLTIPEKHDQALKIMPIIFSQYGYDVYFGNPPYAGYQWVPDLTAFDDCPGVTAFNTQSALNDMRDEMMVSLHDVQNRNGFMFSVYRTAPVFLRSLIYGNGTYNSASAADGSQLTPYQTRTPDRMVGRGVEMTYEDAVSVLRKMGEITTLVDDPTGSVLILENDTTHEDAILQLPDYETSFYVDNRPYSYLCTERTLDGRTMDFDHERSLEVYQPNVAAMMWLGEWFDWMRENGVYDNTRIILVADHGMDVAMFNDMVFGDLDVMTVNPLLLVKDFNATGFTVDNTFMTNADTPSLAFAGLIDNPVNPYTGNPINMDPKNGDVHISLSGHFDILVNNGYTLEPGPWYSVHDSIFEEENWEYLGEY